MNSVDGKFNQRTENTPLKSIYIFARFIDYSYTYQSIHGHSLSLEGHNRLGISRRCKARAVHAFSAGITCRHCTLTITRRSTHTGH